MAITRSRGYIGRAFFGQYGAHKTTRWFTLDGPFCFPLPEDAQGGAAVANAGTPSPAPGAATAAAPPPASAPVPALAPAVSPPFNVSNSLVIPQESPSSPAVISAPPSPSALPSRPIGRRRRQHREVDCAPTRGKRNKSWQATRRSVPLLHATRSSRDRGELTHRVAARSLCSLPRISGNKKKQKCGEESRTKALCAIVC